jgi:hypothetical protein
MAPSPRRQEHCLWRRRPAPRQGGHRWREPWTERRKDTPDVDETWRRWLAVTFPSGIATPNTSQLFYNDAETRPPRHD